jgi:hypothetical protein
VDTHESSPGTGKEDHPKPKTPRRRTRSGPPHRRNGADPGASGAAPGLPRLALDGAIEAAKLPVKVGVNITFRALDALTQSLRRR